MSRGVRMLQGPRAERRRWERISVEMRAEVPGKLHGGWCTAEVVDISWHGVRVRGELAAFERGRYVDLVISQGSNRDQRRARVAWVESTGEHASQAGLEFA